MRAGRLIIDEIEEPGPSFLIKDAPGASQIVVVSVCMEPDTLQPFFASAKQVCIGYVFAYSPEGFTRALCSISEGEIDVSRVKILVEPSGT